MDNIFQFLRRKNEEGEGRKQKGDKPLLSYVGWIRSSPGTRVPYLIYKLK